MCRKEGLVFAAALAALMIGDASAQTADCSTLLTDAKAAQGNVDQLSTMRDDAEKACKIDVSVAVSRLLGFALFNKAREASAADRIALLKDAVLYVKDWRVLAALGAEQLKAGDLPDAARSLQSALIVIQETSPTPAPPSEVVARLITMTNNARAAAPSYVKADTTRSGKPGGVAADKIAGVDIETVPFPIEFVFNESTPTEDGAFAISDLAEILASDVARQSNRVFILAGHTDPVGDEASNQKLSERRAASVRDALLAVGALNGAEIRVVGCGETSPPKIESPEFYSEDEVHQIMRRVELIRSGRPCP